MYRKAEFKTSEPEEWTFDENEEPEVPGGEVLARKICAGVEPAAKSVSEVTQHEYYGWGFEVSFEAARVHCVLNAVDEECVFTIQLLSRVPSFLRSGRTRRAFTECEGAFDAVLRQLPEISEVTWSNL